MSKRDTLNELLVHQATVAPEITNASTLIERTERSLCLAESFCHGKGLHPVNIQWPLVDFVLGGKIARNNEHILSDEHSDVIDTVGTLRKQMQNNVGALVSKVELQIPYHQIKPVHRPVWVGKLSRPSPNYELRRCREGQFAVTLKGLVSKPHIGTGPIEERYFGDSNTTKPMPVRNNTLSVAAYGFVLSAHGIEQSDDNFPSLVYGKENILSVVVHSDTSTINVNNLHACLDQIGLPHS